MVVVGGPSRLQKDRRAIEKNNDGWFENPEWSLDEQQRLRLIFDIVLPHRGFKLSMAYHNTLPASPPSIHSVGEIERVSGHKYGVGGELCPPTRSDNWSTSEARCRAHAPRFHMCARGTAPGSRRRAGMVTKFWMRPPTLCRADTSAETQEA